jgi:hypothetical protein
MNVVSASRKFVVCPWAVPGAAQAEPKESAPAARNARACEARARTRWTDATRRAPHLKRERAELRGERALEKSGA